MKKIDALTRRFNDKLKNDDNERQKHQLKTVLTSERLNLQSIKIIDENNYLTFVKKIMQRNLSNKTCNQMRKKLLEDDFEKSFEISSFFRIKNCVIKKNHLYKTERL